jgi:hypothetical protein
MGNNFDYQFEELSVEHIYSIDLRLLTSVYHDVRKTFSSPENFLWLIYWQIFNGFSRCLSSVSRSPTIDSDLCRFVGVSYYERFFDAYQGYIGKGWQSEH